MHNQNSSIILNPTENIPMNNTVDYSILEGYYISDDIRNSENKIIFAGRNTYTEQLNNYKKDWCKYIKCKDIDFRFLSGLHAHIITFMSIGNIGDTILLLPESAGGHFSTEAILKRLGYNVILAVPDNNNFCVDIKETMDLIEKHKPRFLFIDRSEGLYYEDFSWIQNTGIPYKVFDGSQYLTQILSGYYPSPFDCGFDILLSSTHKNYPGPQKAFLATVNEDNYWEKIKFGSATYISNSHPKDLMSVAASITNIEKIKQYSKLLIDISSNLESELYKRDFPIILKKGNKLPTQHIWAHFNSKEKCYDTFKKLESIGILTNYRLLPYNLGYGLRIGVGAAIQQGLREKDVSKLASLMADCHHNYTESIKNDSIDFIKSISNNGKFI